MIKIGKESQEVSFKLYKGIAALNVLAVNPNKAELEKITGRTFDKEPEYIGKDDNGNDTMRLTFWCKTDEKSKVNNGIKMVIPVVFMLTKAKKVGATSGKIQVIDKYGRTAWATADDVKEGKIPMYSNGPANISEGYRPVFQHEEYLIDFLINWLNIPSCMNYNGETKKWTMKEDASDSEISLNVNDIFAGKLDEFKELIKLAEGYAVKGCVGIRTTDDGKQYQQVFERAFAKNGVTNYSKLEKAVTDFKANGGAPNTEFDFTPLHENVVEATSFEEKKEEDSDLPW